MEQVTFNKIHQTVISCLDTTTDETKLESIGKWYHLFLENKEKKKLYLTVPYYKQEFMELGFMYLRIYTFLYTLLKNAEECKSFEDKCLFNIFDYKENKSQGINELLLTFNKIDKLKGVVLWDKGIITSAKGFLPVFKKENIEKFKNNDTIAFTFNLFKAIRQNQLIDYPIALSFDNLIIAFDNTKQQDLKSIINENLFEIKSKIKREEAIKFKRELGDNLQFNIQIKYPHSKRVPNPLNNIGDKKFQLNFKNRFAYQEVDQNNIFLLTQELNEQKVELKTQKIKVVDTNHSSSLYFLMKQFREEWGGLELNKFTYPFPKYWFLFINDRLKPEEWLALFKTYYPAVENRPIIKIFKDIVDELVTLNWTTNLSNDRINFIFPELTNNRLKKIDEIFRIFKAGIKESIQFNDNEQIQGYEHNYFLDSFNKIDLANKVQENSYENTEIIIPDFLFFNVNPFLKYSLFKYVNTPLTSNRSELDSEDVFFSNDYIKEYNITKQLLLTEARGALKIYDKKYIKNSKEEEKEEEWKEYDIDEVLYFSNDEELENNENKLNKLKVKGLENTNRDELNRTKVSIETVLGHNYDFDESDKVLIKENSIIKISPNQLKKGDAFLSIKELEESLKLKNNQLINLDKLTEVPENAQKYKSELRLKSNAFKSLQLLGASYISENYFNKEFIKSEEFHLPLKKSDWQIICDYLNISENNRDITFIAWYGRKEKNNIKKIYTNVLQILIEKDLLGEIESENSIAFTLKELEKKDKEYKNYLEKLESEIEDFNLYDFAKTILSNITQELSFNEVRSVTIE